MCVCIHTHYLILQVHVTTNMCSGVHFAAVIIDVNDYFSDIKVNGNACKHG